MTLKEHINNKIVESMKCGNKDVLALCREVKSDIEAQEKRYPHLRCTEQEAVDIVGDAIKARTINIAALKEGDERINKFSSEIEILKSLLINMPSDDVIYQWISNIATLHNITENKYPYMSHLTSTIIDMHNGTVPKFLINYYIDNYFKQTNQN